MKKSVICVAFLIAQVCSQTTMMKVFQKNGESLYFNVTDLDSVKFCAASLNSAGSDTLQALIDNRISTNTTNRYGSDTLLWVGAYDNFTISRSLLQFSIPTNMGNKVVKSAKIQLTLAKWLTASDWSPILHQMTVQPVLGQWDELQTTSTMKNGVLKWAVANGDTLVDLAPIKQTFSVSYDPTSIFPKFEINAMSFLEYWKNNPNYGLMIRTNFEKKGAYYPAFYSREATQSAFRPKLIIEYESFTLECP